MSIESASILVMAEAGDTVGHRSQELRGVADDKCGRLIDPPVTA